MKQLHFPWLEAAVLVPLLGAALVARGADFERMRRWSTIAAGLGLLLATAAWIDLGLTHVFEAHDRWDLTELLFGVDLLVVDELTAPLLPLAALQFFLTILATLGTKAARFSFPGALVSMALVLATLSCKLHWPLVVLMVLAPIPPAIEIWGRGGSPRVFLMHMGLFAVLLLGGQSLVWGADPGSASHLAGVLFIALAVLLRSGAAPTHCWMHNLFQRASFGTALLFISPMTGACLAMRLLLPIAPDWVLRLVSVASLLTALYASAMTLVQTDSRRFFSYLLLANASLVLIGMELATPISLTAALCVWLSVGLALTGFGLTMRAIEARLGYISLDRYHGLYPAAPLLAGFFLLTGLASVGFPGTVGFIATELLVEGAIDAGPTVGVVVAVVTALNGLAVLRAYFRIFTGIEHVGTIDLGVRPPERLAVLVLSALIVAGGLVPQPGIASRRHAAGMLLEQRQAALGPRNHREKMVHSGPDSPKRY